MRRVVKPPPTQAELRKCVSRGGRVFLFEYPNVSGTHNALMPSFESSEKIENRIASLEGVKSVEGPFVNGVLAITVYDDEGVGKFSDDEICDRIASIFRHYWRWDKEDAHA